MLPSLAHSPITPCPAVAGVEPMASTRPRDPPLQWALDVLIDSGLRSEEHTSELQSLRHLACRLLLEKKAARDDRAGPRHYGPGPRARPHYRSTRRAPESSGQRRPQVPSYFFFFAGPGPRGLPPFPQPAVFRR